MKKREKDILQFISILVIVLLINFISSIAHNRFDLTKEGRFSLSEASKSLLSSIEDYIYIEVYLEGDFPAGIERLSIETKQILSELRSQNHLIQYTFINPIEDPDDKTRNEIISQLYAKGLHPTNLQVKEQDGYTEKIIIPGAIIKYRGKEIAVQLLKNQIARSPNQNIEKSISELEYEFINAIKELKNPIKSNISFLTGHGELDGVEIEDLTKALSEKYIIDKIDLREFEVDANGEPNLLKKLNDLNQRKLILILKPKSSFQNLDKYLIDQYIMNGGKVLWMIDATNADMDSLTNKGTFLAHPLRDLNLGDQLFKYGVRINTNLIQDLSSSKVPIPVSFVNDIPKWELMQWRYFAISIPTSNHPITNNLNAIKFNFAGSIDTIKTNSSIKKTILLHSSPYTKLINTPYEISLQNALNKPKEEEFNKGPQALAVLLEGSFESLFKNRISQINKKLPFKESSKLNRMLVIADGDLAKNQISRGNALPLGFDSFEKRQYGNKEFILNAIDFLIEHNDFIDIRTKELKMRILDSQKTNQERLFWQVLNIISPIILILLFGFIKQYLRIKKYTQ